jgi:type II secretion system protein L
VLVIGRERLKRLVAQFKALGRPLDAAWSALACLPETPNGWTVAADRSHWLLRISDARAFVDDAPQVDGSSVELPPIVTVLLSQAQAQGTLPASIVTLGVSQPAATALATHHANVVQESTWHWHEVSGDATNLLHGEFQPAHARGQLLRAVRPALILIAIVLGTHLVLGTGSAMLREQDLKEIKARMTQLAHTQLPGRALQDPALQIHRELQTLRQRNGLLADDDALAMLSDLSIALGSDATASLQNIHHEGGTLVITLAKPLDVPALQNRLETRGIRSTLRGANTLSLQRNTQ